ncbi:sphingomyelin phosphodiesterase 4, neutral membrane (neutral sphingomyelinase-3) [Irineochytrium annulatum]|nr:sphingomyelin phosphodiesterase 4, neutral membrane (neutral sphingomyelinase-3) [Irineochytrium annulatum]
MGKRLNWQRGDMKGDSIAGGAGVDLVYYEILDRYLRFFIPPLPSQPVAVEVQLPSTSIQSAARRRSAMISRDSPLRESGVGGPGMDGGNKDRYGGEAAFSTPLKVGRAMGDAKEGLRKGAAVGNKIDPVTIFTTKFAYQTIQRPLYNFLKVSFLNYEIDDGFAVLVEIWLAYTFPWKPDAGRRGRIGTTSLSADNPISDEWYTLRMDCSANARVTRLPHIAQNYLFYSNLMRCFLTRAAALDLFAAARPAKLTAASTTRGVHRGPSAASVQPSRYRAHLECVERVFQSFDNAKDLLSILRSFEDMLLAADAQRSPLSPMATPTRSRQLSGSQSDFAAPLWLRKYGKEMIMSWIRNDALLLEGKLDFEAVFKASETSRSGQKIKQFLLNDHASINRLNTYMPVKLERPQDGASASKKDIKVRVNPPVNLEEETSAMAIMLSYVLVMVAMAGVVWGYILSAFTTLTSDTSDPDAAVKSAIELSIKRLSDLANLTKTVFDVSEVTLAEIKEASGGAGVYDDGVGLEDYELNNREIAPGVYTPSSMTNKKLTERGKEEIKRGIRKCAQDDVPVMQTARIRRIVHSYEVGVAVEIVIWIADRFDDWHDLRKNYELEMASKRLVESGFDPLHACLLQSGSTIYPVLSARQNKSVAETVGRLLDHLDTKESRIRHLDDNLKIASMERDVAEKRLKEAIDSSREAAESDMKIIQNQQTHRNH